MENNKLIDLLEKDMSSDISEFDCADEDITFENVQHWYIETEKLFRTIANIFSEDVVQTVNQLRYAGHHVIKSLTLNNQDEDDQRKKQENIVEAVKHCKRAYYDALDFFVYKLFDVYKSKIQLVDNNWNETKEIKDKLNHYIEEVVQYRNAKNRISYYKNVHKILIPGLRLIVEIDNLLNDKKVSLDLIKNKSALIEERDYCIEQLDTKIEHEGHKLKKLSIALATMVGVLTFIGLLFEGQGIKIIKAIFN